MSSIQMGETTFASAHLRTAGPPLQFAAAAAGAVASMGREHILGAYSEMLFGNSVVAERMGTVVSLIVGLLALSISCIGLFALLTHSVEKRTREVGIRIAVGATPVAVSKIIVGDSLRLVIAGLVIGLPAAFGAASIVRSLLYGVTTTDTVTITASMGLLVVTALVATVRPAIRAAQVDPAAALRAQ